MRTISLGKEIAERLTIAYRRLLLAGKPPSKSFIENMKRTKVYVGDETPEQLVTIENKNAADAIAHYRKKIQDLLTTEQVKNAGQNENQKNADTIISEIEKVFLQELERVLASDTLMRGENGIGFNKAFFDLLNNNGDGFQLASSIKPEKIIISHENGNTKLHITTGVNLCPFGNSKNFIPLGEMSYDFVIDERGDFHFEKVTLINLPSDQSILRQILELDPKDEDDARRGLLLTMLTHFNDYDWRGVDLSDWDRHFQTYGFVVDGKPTTLIDYILAGITDNTFCPKYPLTSEQITWLANEIKSKKIALTEKQINYFLTNGLSEALDDNHYDTLTVANFSSGAFNMLTTDIKKIKLDISNVTWASGIASVFKVGEVSFEATPNEFMQEILAQYEKILIDDPKGPLHYDWIKRLSTKDPGKKLFLIWQHAQEEPTSRTAQAFYRAAYVLINRSLVLRADLAAARKQLNIREYDAALALAPNEKRGQTNFITAEALQSGIVDFNALQKYYLSKDEEDFPYSVGEFTKLCEMVRANKFRTLNNNDFLRLINFIAREAKRHRVVADLTGTDFTNRELCIAEKNKSGGITKVLTAADFSHLNLTECNFADTTGLTHVILDANTHFHHSIYGSKAGQFPFYYSYYDTTTQQHEKAEITEEMFREQAILYLTRIQNKYSDDPKKIEEIKGKIKDLKPNSNRNLTLNNLIEFLRFCESLDPKSQPLREMFSEYAEKINGLNCQYDEVIAQHAAGKNSCKTIIQAIDALAEKITPRALHPNTQQKNYENDSYAMLYHYQTLVDPTLDAEIDEVVKNNRLSNETKLSCVKKIVERTRASYITYNQDGTFTVTLPLAIKTVKAFEKAGDKLQPVYEYTPLGTVTQQYDRYAIPIGEPVFSNPALAQDIAFVRDQKIVPPLFRTRAQFNQRFLAQPANDGGQEFMRETTSLVDDREQENLPEGFNLLSDAGQKIVKKDFIKISMETQPTILIQHAAEGFYEDFLSKLSDLFAGGAQRENNPQRTITINTDINPPTLTITGDCAGYLPGAGTTLGTYTATFAIDENTQQTYLTHITFDKKGVNPSKHPLFALLNSANPAEDYEQQSRLLLYILEKLTEEMLAIKNDEKKRDEADSKKLNEYKERLREAAQIYIDHAQQYRIPIHLTKLTVLDGLDISGCHIGDVSGCDLRKVTFDPENPPKFYPNENDYHPLRKTKLSEKLLQEIFRQNQARETERRDLINISEIDLSGEIHNPTHLSLLFRDRKVCNFTGITFNEFTIAGRERTNLERVVEPWRRDLEQIFDPKELIWEENPPSYFAIGDAVLEFIPYDFILKVSHISKLLNENGLENIVRDFDYINPAKTFLKLWQLIQKKDGSDTYRWANRLFGMAYYALLKEQYDAQPREQHARHEALLLQVQNHFDLTELDVEMATRDAIKSIPKFKVGNTAYDNFISNTLGKDGGKDVYLSREQLDQLCKVMREGSYQHLSGEALTNVLNFITREAKRHSTFGEYGKPYIADLHGINLRQKKLSDVSFSHLNLTGANFYQTEIGAFTVDDYTNLSEIRYSNEIKSKADASYYYETYDKSEGAYRRTLITPDLHHKRFYELLIKPEKDKKIKRAPTREESETTLSHCIADIAACHSAHVPQPLIQAFSRFPVTLSDLGADTGYSSNGVSDSGEKSPPVSPRRFPLPYSGQTATDIGAWLKTNIKPSQAPEENDDSYLRLALSVPEKESQDQEKDLYNKLKKAKEENPEDKLLQAYNLKIWFEFLATHPEHKDKDVCAIADEGARRNFFYGYKNEVRKKLAELSKEKKDEQAKALYDELKNVANKLNIFPSDEEFNLAVSDLDFGQHVTFHTALTDAEIVRYKAQNETLRLGKSDFFRSLSSDGYAQLVTPDGKIQTFSSFIKAYSQELTQQLLLDLLDLHALSPQFDQLINDQNTDENTKKLLKTLKNWDEVFVEGDKTRYSKEKFLLKICQGTEDSPAGSFLTALYQLEQKTDAEAKDMAAKKAVHIAKTWFARGLNVGIEDKKLDYFINLTSTPTVLNAKNVQKYRGKNDRVVYTIEDGAPYITHSEQLSEMAERGKPSKAVARVEFKFLLKDVDKPPIIRTLNAITLEGPQAYQLRAEMTDNNTAQQPYLLHRLMLQPTLGAAAASQLLQHPRHRDDTTPRDYSGLDAPNYDFSRFDFSHSYVNEMNLSGGTFSSATNLQNCNLQDARFDIHATITLKHLVPGGVIARSITVKPEILVAEIIKLGVAIPNAYKNVTPGIALLLIMQEAQKNPESKLAKAFRQAHYDCYLAQVKQDLEKNAHTPAEKLKIVKELLALADSWGIQRNLSGLKLDGVDLTGLDLSNTLLCNTSLIGAKFDHANLSGVTINDNTLLKGCTFDCVRMTHLIRQSADGKTNVNLTDVQWWNTFQKAYNDCRSAESFFLFKRSDWIKDQNAKKNSEDKFISSAQAILEAEAHKFDTTFTNGKNRTHDACQKMMAAQVTRVNTNSTSGLPSLQPAIIGRIPENRTEFVGIDLTQAENLNFEHIEAGGLIGAKLSPAQRDALIAHAKKITVADNKKAASQKDQSRRFDVEGVNLPSGRDQIVEFSADFRENLLPPPADDVTEAFSSDSRTIADNKKAATQKDPCAWWGLQGVDLRGSALSPPTDVTEAFSTNFSTRTTNLSGKNITHFRELPFDVDADTDFSRTTITAEQACVILAPPSASDNGASDRANAQSQQEGAPKAPEEVLKEIFGRILAMPVTAQNYLQQKLEITLLLVDFISAFQNAVHRSQNVSSYVDRRAMPLIIRELFLNTLNTYNEIGRNVLVRKIISAKNVHEHASCYHDIFGSNNLYSGGLAIFEEVFSESLTPRAPDAKKIGILVALEDRISHLDDWEKMLLVNYIEKNEINVSSGQQDISALLNSAKTAEGFTNHNSLMPPVPQHHNTRGSGLFGTSPGDDSNKSDEHSPANDSRASTRRSNVSDTRPRSSMRVLTPVAAGALRHARNLAQQQAAIPVRQNILAEEYNLLAGNSRLHQHNEEKKQNRIALLINFLLSENNDINTLENLDPWQRVLVMDWMILYQHNNNKESLQRILKKIREEAYLNTIARELGLTQEDKLSDQTIETLKAQYDPLYKELYDATIQQVAQKNYTRDTPIQPIGIESTQRRAEYIGRAYALSKAIIVEESTHNSYKNLHARLLSDEGRDAEKCVNDFVTQKQGQHGEASPPASSVFRFGSH
ncbi:MAG: hypothetical protein A3E84_05440 [Gammaproteobacteria bacterium RIFCSPHIGHO2_12_FULL_42_13]|nr:MAG: hypothetical protein A3E84_05440 [Gammaproteobacteria bacterium RIFCSPHIGHO2_12_FULL_42_13]